MKSDKNPFTWREILNSDANAVTSLVCIACFIGMLVIWIAIIKTVPTMPVLRPY